MKDGKPMRRNRSLKTWMRVVTISGLVLAIFIFVEMVANRYSQRLDVTLGKDYTLSKQTEKVLKSLENDINFSVFYRMGDRAELEELFKNVAYFSPHIKFSLIDLDRYPGKAEVYGVSSYGQTVVEYQGKKEILGFPTENRIVNIILKLTHGVSKVVLFSKGHGERDIRANYMDVSQALRNENYEVDDVLLMEESSVLENCSVLVIAGPKKDFLESEVPVLSQYLGSGGKVVILLEPFVTLPNLERFVREYRIIFDKDIIIDTKNKVFLGDPYAPLIPYYAQHSLTHEMKSSSIFFTARSLSLIDQKDESMSVVPLARTSDKSWAKTNIDEIKRQEISFEKDTDKRGPFITVAMVNINGAEKEKTGGTLVCFGDSDFIDAKFFGLLGNADFFLNTINWLSKETDLISIRSSGFEYPYHYMSSIQGKWIFWIPVVIIPVVFLLIGVMLFIYRKRHV